MSSKTNSYNKPGAIIIEGHVQGLSNTRSLGEAGIPVFVIDKDNCIARYSKYCTKFFRCPDFSRYGFAEFLTELAQSEGIKDWVLVPSNDHAVYTISKNKELLEQYYKIITPDLNIIDKIYDKATLINIAKQVNVPVPLTQLFYSENEELNRDINYPVIIKGRKGLSFYKAIGKKVLLANNDKELRKQLALIRKRYFIDGTFTQELIPFNGSNYTISFTAFCINGEIKTHWSGVKLREHPIRFGTATFAKSITNLVCYQQSVSLLKQLYYTGVCEVEYLMDSRTGEYKLIEMNPRTWLWIDLARECGIDYLIMMYNYANGLRNSYPQTYKTNLFWINPLTDTAFSVLAVFKGRLTIKQYFTSLLNGKKVNALLRKGDSKPLLAYIAYLFAFLKER